MLCPCWPSVCVCVFVLRSFIRPFCLFFSLVVCLFTPFHCHSHTQELLHFVFVEKTDSKPDTNVSFGQCSSWAAPKRLAWIACKHVVPSSNLWTCVLSLHNASWSSSMLLLLLWWWWWPLGSKPLTTTTTTTDDDDDENLFFFAIQRQRNPAWWWWWWCVASN